MPPVSFAPPVAVPLACASASGTLHAALVRPYRATTPTLSFGSGDTEATLTVSAAGLSASDTVMVGFGTLPAGDVAGRQAEAKVAVTEAAGSSADAGDLNLLAIEYAEASHTVVAGGPGAEVTVRITPPADREVSVPVRVTGADGMAGEYAGYGIPRAVRFEPGDSVATFLAQAPAEAPAGTLALGFGALPEAVRAGPAATSVVHVIAADAGPCSTSRSKSGSRSSDVPWPRVPGRPSEDASTTPCGRTPCEPGSPARVWPVPTGARAVRGLASLTGAPLNGARLGGSAAAPRTLELPTGREAAPRLLPAVSFSKALGAQTAGSAPRFSVWGEGSAQGYRGEPGGVAYDGGMRALTVGVDARIGTSALLGLSVMRSDGDFDYSNQTLAGTLGHAMNTVHPYLFVQPSPRIGVWVMGGYGSGNVEDEEPGRTLDATLRMISGGVSVPLARRGGFGLGLSGDEFGVRMSTDGQGGEGTATRARALIEASYAAGGLKLATHAGARLDGGDADTGAGTEVGASIGYAGNGVDLAFNTRLGASSDGHWEWGAGLRLAWDPGARCEGLRLAVSPARGHDRSGVRALLDNGTFAASRYGAGAQPLRTWRLDAETGYGFKAHDSRSLDAYGRLSARDGGHNWTLGSGYDIASRLKLRIEGVRAHALTGGTTQGLRLGLDFKF